MRKQKQTADARISYAWWMRFAHQVSLTAAWVMVLSLWVQEQGAHHLIEYFMWDAGLTIVGALLAMVALSCTNRKLFLSLFLVLSGGLVVSALTVFRGAMFMPYLLIAAKSLAFTQVSTALHRQAESLFSPSEARIAMPKIETAMTTGAVVGAGLTLALVSFGSGVLPLWVWAGLCVSLFAGVLMKDSLTGDIPTLHASPALHARDGNPLREAWGHITNTPFVRMATLLLLTTGAVGALVEFGFLQELLHHGGDHGPSIAPAWLKASLLPNGIGANLADIAHQKTTNLFAHSTLAHELGALHLGFAVFALAIQTFITPVWIEKMGVVRGWLWYGAGLSLAVIGSALGLCSPTMLRLAQHTTHSLGEGPYHMSYYALPQRGRESARLLLDGVVQPLGVLAGVAVLGAWSLVEAQIVWGALLLTTLGFLPSLLRAYTQLAVGAMRTDARVHDRLHYAEVLAQKGHDAPAAHLAELLADHTQPEVVRAHLVATLGRMQTPDDQHVAVQTLLTHLSDPHTPASLTHRILESLHGMTDLPEYLQQHPWAYHHLRHSFLQLLESGDPYQKKMTIQVLFGVLSAEELVPWFLQHMDRVDLITQSVFLRSCRQFQNDPSLRHFVAPYLTHPVPRLRGSAIIALWAVGDQAALRADLQAMLQSHNDEEQVAALYAIGEVTDTQLQDAVWHCATMPDARLRLHALIAGGKLGDNRVLGPLAQLIRDEPPERSLSVWRMAQRIDADLKHQLRALVHESVAEDTSLILRTVRWQINDLSGEILAKLSHLYHLADRHDDLLALHHLNEKTVGE